MPNTGKQQIEYIASLYTHINNPEWYHCVQILKSNYDQFGVDTSISPTKLLVGNIKHFKTRESRKHELRVLYTCHKQLRGSNKYINALAKEIMKQLVQYKNVIKRRQTRKRSIHKKSRKLRVTKHKHVH
jgi:hypothetical protein